MKYKSCCLMLATALVCGLAVADSITIGDTTYTDVFVREGGAMYYVQFPETGEVLSVRKDAVPEGGLVISSDALRRDALRAQWREAYAARNPDAMAPAAAAESEYDAMMRRASEPEAAPEPYDFRLRGDERAYALALQQGQQYYATDGYVPYINLQNVPLKDALKALLRQQGLDYKVHNNIVYVNRPDLLRREAWEEVETRYYQLANAGSETLPKIVMVSPQLGGGFGQGGFGGGLGGFGGGAGGIGGGGFGGIGGGGIGGGLGGGLGGGFGGGGFGGGGFGGGGFGEGGDVTALANISQLFQNIDDRRVGEPPAIIGPSYVVSTRPAQQRQPGLGGGQLGGGFGGGFMNGR